MTQVNNIVNIVKPVKLGMLVNRVKLVSLVVIAKIPGAFCGIGERKKRNICFNLSTFEKGNFPITSGSINIQGLTRLTVVLPNGGFPLNTVGI